MATRNYVTNNYYGSRPNNRNNKKKTQKRGWAEEMGRSISTIDNNGRPPWE